MTESASRTELRVEVMRSEAAFDGIRTAWNALAARATHSVFLRHEWLSAAWAWRRMDSTLWIPCVYAGDTLVGALPMVRPLKTGHGGRVLQFLSVPDTQCCDLLAERRNVHDVCVALVEHFVRTSEEWDGICLERLPSQSIAAAVLKPVFDKRAVRCTVEATECNLYIDLRCGWEAYYATRSRRFKKALNLAANRVTRVGPFEVQRLHADNADPQRVQEFLDAMQLISERSWKSSTGTTLNMPGPCAFIQRLTESAYSRDWLSMWLLRIEGRPVAMEYQVVFDREVHALRSDFDEDYKSASPGSFLSRRVVEALFGNGCNRYYMGPGRNSYKTRWSVTGEPLETLVAYSPTLRGHALSFWPHDVKPRLRKLRDRFVPAISPHI